MLRFAIMTSLQIIFIFTSFLLSKNIFPCQSSNNFTENNDRINRIFYFLCFYSLHLESKEHTFYILLYGIYWSWAKTVKETSNIFQPSGFYELIYSITVKIHTEMVYNYYLKIVVIIYFYQLLLSIFIKSYKIINTLWSD